MEKNIFDALPGFDHLPERYSFDALPDKEKEQVLNYITREEYERFREAVLASKREEAGVCRAVMPDPRVKERLMSAFDAGGAAHPAPVNTLFTRILCYRIPAYQAGLAATVLLFLLVYSFIQMQHRSPQMAVADTVFIDRPVRVTDTLWLEKQVEPSQEKRDRSLPLASGEKEPSGERFENPLYARQMEEALDRMTVITELSKDKTGHRDAVLMKLVSTGLPLTGE